MADMHKKSFDTVHNNNAQYYFIKETYLFSKISISYQNVICVNLSNDIVEEI